MSWVILVTAGLLEVVWAIGLKYTDGFTRLWPTLITVSAMLLSVWLLGIALKSLPVGSSSSSRFGEFRQDFKFAAYYCRNNRIEIILTNINVKGLGEFQGLFLMRLLKNIQTP